MRLHKWLLCHLEGKAFKERGNRSDSDSSASYENSEGSLQSWDSDRRKHKKKATKAPKTPPAEPDQAMDLLALPELPVNLREEYGDTETLLHKASKSMKLQLLKSVVSRHARLAILKQPGFSWTGRQVLGIFFVKSIIEDISGY